MMFKGNDKGNVKIEMDFSNLQVSVEKAKIQSVDQETVNVNGRMSIDISGDVNYVNIVDMKEGAAKLIINTIKEIFFKKIDKK